MFFNIVLISTGCYYVTCIIKLKILIFKLKDQITEIKNLIVLLDNHALILEKSLEQQAENRIIAASIGLAIVIVIGLLFFFFSGGGGPGGSSIPSDSFTPRGSEGSLSRSSSSTDLGGKDTYTENLVLQQEQLNKFQFSLDEILGVAANKLLPTLSNWIEFSQRKIISFDESPTWRVGNAFTGWMESLDTSLDKIRNNEESMEVLKSVDNTMKSITDHLPDFLKELDTFMSKANLNIKTRLETGTKDYEFILESREIANKLL